MPPRRPSVRGLPLPRCRACRRCRRATAAAAACPACSPLFAVAEPPPPAARTTRRRRRRASRGACAAAVMLPSGSKVTQTVAAGGRSCSDACWQQIVKPSTTTVSTSSMGAAARRRSTSPRCRAPPAPPRCARHLALLGGAAVQAADAGGCAGRGATREAGSARGASAASEGQEGARVLGGGGGTAGGGARRGRAGAAGRRRAAARPAGRVWGKVRGVGWACSSFLRCARQGWAGGRGGEGSPVFRSCFSAQAFACSPMNSIANSRPQIGHGIWGASRFVARRPPTRPADGPSKLLLEASEVIADADGGALGAATASRAAGEARSEMPIAQGPRTLAIGGERLGKSRRASCAHTNAPAPGARRRERVYAGSN